MARCCPLRLHFRWLDTESGHWAVAVPSYWAAQRIENRSGFQEGEIMKIRFAVAMAATLFAGALAMAAYGSWTGYISDSHCGVKGANVKAGKGRTKGRKK